MYEEEKAARHKNARCTDACCAVIWLACVVLVGLVFKEAQHKADVRKLFHGIDWDGNVCGLGDKEHDPFLYWCPQGHDVLNTSELVKVGIQPAKATTKVHAASEDLQLDYPICVSSCPRGGGTVHRCLANTSVAQSVVDEDTGTFVEEKAFIFQIVQDIKTDTLGHMYCLPQDQRRVNEFEGKFSWGLQAFLFHLAQAEEARYTVLAAVGMAMLLGYAYLFLAKCVGRLLVYLSILAGVLFPIAAGLYIVFGREIRQQADREFHQDLQEFTSGTPSIVLFR